ncbi:hypothetical protein [Flavobacterium sp.]|jgi:hypothetical protein|uniref:hypothetical protein n=1 Tax=Flavobacterium sp. TaxID=239 RepID=UPI0037C0FEB4
MKKIIALLTFAIVGISCSDDSDLPDGSFGDTPRVVGFLKSSQNVNYFADEGQVVREFPFDVLGTGDGAPYNQDITLTYQVVTSATTAVLGDEYEWFDTTSKVVIPAGSSFGLLKLKVNTGNFDPVNKTTLVLEITAVDKEGFVISNLSKRVSINFVGCLSQVQGLYNLVVTRGDGVTVNRSNELVTVQGVNVFKTTTTGTFTVAQLSPPAPYAGYLFTDICDDIIVEKQNLGGAYSNLVQGLSTTGEDGKVLNDNQFRVRYEVTFAAGNQTYIGEYTRAN